MYKCAASGLLKRAEGATVIEYAITLPILLLIIMGIIEYNTIMYAMSVLDGATVAAARMGKTGYVNTTASGTCPSPVVNGSVSPQSQAQYINCYVGVHVGGLLSTSKLQISYRDTGSSSFNAANNAPVFPSGPCTNDPTLANPPTFPMCIETNQTSGNIVVYTMTYPWPVYSPVLRPFLGGSGTYTLYASAVVKNEPYTVGR